MSEQLPPALRPWEEELAVFPSQVAVSLLEPIRRLSAAIGPLYAPPVHGDGEPDGFDGVDRRGPFDRLLLSEWLLASEIPMEFLRRAADREQSFLKLRRVDPGTSRRTVVLLDGGPSQVGEPRLAQLVALVVLARRARVANSEFRWGLLHRPELFDGLSRAAMLAFRGGSSHGGPRQEQVDGWRERLEEEQAQADDDLWVVGDVDELQCPTRLVVQEQVRPGPRSLLLALRRGAATRVLELDLPPPQECVAAFRCPLLRPGSSRAAPSREPTGEGPIWFSPDGNRLIVLQVEGARAVHVPNSVHALRAGRGATRQWETPNLLAVGFRGKRFCGLTLEEGVVRDFKGRECPLPKAFELPEGVARAYENNSGTYVIDAARQLWRFPLGQRMAVAVSGWDAEGYYLQAAGRTVLRLWSGGQREISPDEVHVVPGARAAWAREDGRWQVLDTMLRVASLPEGSVVCGTTRGGGEGWPAALLCLDSSGHRVLRVGAKETVLVASTEPITHLVAAPVKAHFAFRTASGGLRFYLDEELLFELDHELQGVE